MNGARNRLLFDKWGFHPNGRLGNGLINFDCLPERANIERDVLVVEDDENDILLIKRAFDRAGLGQSIHSVQNGSAAIAYLLGQRPYEDREKHPFPALVLLDIKMPGMDGFEVLRWIRQQPALAGLCVVMLTSSDQIKDANTAYQQGANSFLVKPLDFWNVEELMRSLGRLIQKNC